MEKYVTVRYKLIRSELSYIYNKIINSITPQIMGIVNVTPDSFSDGNKYFSVETALKHAAKLWTDGADIIDIGGESTRPGAEKVTVDEEIKRVIPIIEKIKNKIPQVIISIDTTKSKVAELAVEAGANIINDISGGHFDGEIYNVAAKYDIPYIIMHMKGTPQNMQDSPFYNNVIEEICKYFEETIDQAKKKGVEKIILDPGIGFGKRITDNYSILSNLEEFNKFKLPILVGVSRKSFLGKSLDLEIDQRENSTVITETIAAINGAKIIRTHNVKNAVELKKVFELIKENNLQYV